MLGPLHQRLRPLGGVRSRGYMHRLMAIWGDNLVAYWPLYELSGTTINSLAGTGLNGTYSACTLGQPGIGDGNSAVSLNGASSVGSVFSAALQSVFNSQELTIGGWVKVSASGVWTDGVSRGILRIGVDANNLVQINKSTASNLLSVAYIAGGTNKNIQGGSSSTDWLFWLATVSKSANQLKAYLNGVQVGTTQTGLGTWAGALASTLCVIGALITGPANVWSGFLQHIFLLNRAATADEAFAASIIGA